MKDFGRWFSEQALPPSLDEQMEDLGCWKDGGRWMTCCRKCDTTMEIPVTPQEWIDSEDYYRLCSGQFCLP